MTIKEIKEEHTKVISRLREEISKANEEYNTKLKERLEEINLAGMVKRKDNGHIGELRISDGWRDIDFYPLTKKGEISKKAESFYYGGNVEDMFEPYNEKYKAEDKELTANDDLEPEEDLEQD